MHPPLQDPMCTVCGQQSIVGKVYSVHRIFYDCIEVAIIPSTNIPNVYNTIDKKGGGGLEMGKIL